jgi:DnaJ domain
MPVHPRLAEPDVPFYLMPLAAILGIYILLAVGRTLYVLYRAYYRSNRGGSNVGSSGGSRKDAAAVAAAAKQQSEAETTAAVVVPLIVSAIAAAIAYAYVVAKIDRAFLQAEYVQFDPYDILGLSPHASTNATVIKQAYRNLVRLHHPDKSSRRDGGTMFRKLTLAYQSLTVESAMRNYKLYGHPDGPLSTPTFKMSMPNWLLVPKGNIAITLMILYLLTVIIVIGFLVYRLSTQEDGAGVGKNRDKSKKKGSLLDSTNSVSVEDLSYLANALKPDMQHLQILLTIVATPENMEWSMQDLERVEDVRTEQLEKIAEEKKKQQSEAAAAAGAGGALAKNADFEDLVNSGGWDDDDGDEAMKAAKRAEEERKRDLERLRRATGQARVLLEGLDDGVLGQQWVEKTLQEHGVWPPKSIEAFLPPIEYQGVPVTDPLDHPGLRRLLCMTVGRLNSNMLNSHPDLLQAGAKNLIDQTYFKASMEFRQRVGMLLEASLRIGMAMRSQRLVSTTLETVAMFKIGVNVNDPPDKLLSWFNGIMMRQYTVLPRLKVESRQVMNLDEGPDIACGEQGQVVLEVERLHAEHFTKQKIEQFKKQGIPPEVGLQTYREGWWFMLRMKRLDGDTATDPISLDVSPILKAIQVDKASIKAFEREAVEYKLLTAWPMMIQNVAQQKGKIKIQFKAPNEAGKYRYFLDIKSQDFLGADQVLEFDVVVSPKKDHDMVVVPPTEESPKEEEANEPKKEK